MRAICGALSVLLFLLALAAHLEQDREVYITRPETHTTTVTPSPEQP